MTSTNAPSSSQSSDLPRGFTTAIDAATGRLYYINHIDRSTSFRHPRHTYLHEPYTPGVPYPHERIFDEMGRAYYLDREAKTSSWLHPGKLAQLKAKGILDTEEDEGGEAWREWILMEVAEAPNKGQEYWVDYKKGEVDWQSPEGRRTAREKGEARRAAKQ
jgi:hypothetical protein